VIDGSPVRTLARADGVLGEVVLRRRGDVVELVVDGVFTMDSAHTTTERDLATLALERLDGPALRVAVGGLGLGYTAATLLADPRVALLELVELDAVLVDWLGRGLLPGLPAAAVEAVGARLRVHVEDVLTAIPRLGPASVDAVLLDVDNGPGFLVHPDNARVYRQGFLAAAAGVLRPGGVLAVWSSHPAPDLARVLNAAVGACEEVLTTVERDGRRLVYATYLATRPPGRR